MQPRLTAKLVAAYAPRGPAAGNHLARAAAAAGSAVFRGADPIESVQHVLDPDRLGEEFLGPGPHGLENDLTVGRAADYQHRALRSDLPDLLDQFQALLRVGIDRNDANIGLRLAHDIGKELIARAFRLEPDDVHSQQHVFQRVPGIVAGIDNRQAKNVAHRTCGWLGWVCGGGIP